MGFFDKMFEKNEFDKKLDDAYNYFVDNNPVSKKAKSTIEEAKRQITQSLEEELYGTAGERPSVEGDDEELMREWDSMIDQIVDRELSRYKICPSCGEAAPAEMKFCQNCGTKLPEETAEVRICPYCGAKNRTLNLNCVHCGKKLELVPEESDESD